MVGLILVLLLILIAWFSYQWAIMPTWRRAINQLTVLEDGPATDPHTITWLVDPDINAKPFFIQFSGFQGETYGTVTVAKYDIDGSVIDAGFKNWEGVADNLIVGNDKINLRGRVFTFISGADLQNPWRATMSARKLPKRPVVVGGLPPGIAKTL